jgi:predicted DCC family thiol-disulfide oxidoreductase YuxK
MTSNQKDQILFFDGVCNLCNSSVNTVMKYDKREQIKVAPLQGKTAETMLQAAGIDASELDSLVYWRNGKIYTRSSAALRVAKDMGGLWSLAIVFFVVPAFIRDAVYRYIARHRYKWFGKKESCRMPTDSERARFLD